MKHRETVAYKRRYVHANGNDETSQLSRSGQHFVNDGSSLSLGPSHTIGQCDVVFQKRNWDFLSTCGHDLSNLVSVWPPWAHQCLRGPRSKRRELWLFCSNSSCGILSSWRVCYSPWRQIQASLSRLILWAARQMKRIGHVNEGVIISRVSFEQPCNSKRGPARHSLLNHDCARPLLCPDDRILTRSCHDISIYSIAKS